MIRPIAILTCLILAACAAPVAVAPTATPAPPAPTPTMAPPTATPAPAGIVVDAGQALGPISPLVFGSNIGPWTGVPLGMRDQVKAVGLTFMRFPGGNWGDDNDLRDFQIDPYIALCEEFGFTPAISVRLLGSSPESAAAVVRYVNVTRGYGVRYWSIGNEPSLYASSRNVEGYDTERYNREWRAFAEAMRAVDPSIILVGPDTHQFFADGGPIDRLGKSWVREFLKVNGDLVDIVAIHRYPFPQSAAGAAPTVEQLRENSAEWDLLIPALRAIIQQETGRELPVAVTEINANWTGAFRGETTPDSQLAAIWWADVLARLIRQRVEIVAQFAIFGPHREGWGLVEKYKARPAFGVYTLYTQLGETLVAANTDDPLVTALAARRADGALTLALVNRAAEGRSLPLTIAGFVPAGPAEVWRLDAAHPGERLDDLPQLASGAPIDLPGESVTLLILRP